MTKSPWLKGVPFELMRINMSVTTSISSFSESSITPIWVVSTLFNWSKTCCKSLPDISGFSSMYFGMNVHEENFVLNISDISGIQFLLLIWAGVWTANISASLSPLAYSKAAKGLNAILTRLSLNSLLNTFCAAIAVISAVIRCWPSIITFLPEEIVPSFNFTLGFFHRIIYPVG